MRLFTTIAVAALALSTLPAKAADPFLGDTSAPQRTSAFYAALRGGISSIDEFEAGALGDIASNNSYDNISVFGAAAAGVHFSALRLEGEVGYFNANVNHDAASPTIPASIADLADVDVITVMANAYFDLDLGVVTPFIGTGVGVGITSSDLLDDPDPGFAYQLTLGAGIDLSEQLTAELAYRF